MILRKPYAFLIKNFRTIHIILTFLTIYILYKTNTIVDFYKDFVINNYSVTIVDNLASNYVGVLLCFSIVLVIGILIAVFILLKTKNKQNKIYLAGILYYFVLLILVIISYYLINGLELELWSTAAARTYRDIAQMIYYPQFIFIIVLAIRALGFNVKQFNFKNDLKELEITDSDNEEVELNINFQTYKFERTLRRLLREMKYYLKENKIVIFVISLVLIGIFGFMFYKNYEKLDYTYKQKQVFTYNYLKYNITDSMVTNVDMNGNVIYEDKYFVVIRFEVENDTKDDRNLEYNDFKLYYNDDYVYPNLDLGVYFKDYGDNFNGDTIYARSKNTYIMAYMIDSKYKSENFYINLYLGSSKNKKEFRAKSATINLDPVRLGDVEVIRNAKLNEDVSLSSTALGESKITIKDAVITSRYEYNYQNCYNGECRTYTDVVVADNTYQRRQILIAMDYDLVLDNNAPSYKNINDLNAFASSFLKVQYVFDGNTRTANTKYVTPSKLKNKLILQTSGEIMDAEEINLLVTIRNRCYVIKIK